MQFILPNKHYLIRLDRDILPQSNTKYLIYLGMTYIRRMT